MKSKYSYLSKNILLFSLSGLVPKILSFILIPIYTGYLTTGEYGISDLIITTVQLLVPIFTLDIQDAVMRFALDKDYKNEYVFSCAIRIIIIGTAILTVGVCFTSFLNIPQIDNQYLIFLMLMYFTTAVNNTVSLFCRSIDRVKVIVVSSILNSVITLITNILFLVVFNWGLTGYLTANTIGTIVALIYSFIAAKLYHYIVFKVPKFIKKDMIAFSFPLIFSVVAWWVNSSSDRYILTWMDGVAVSGLYAVAYKIPNLLAMFQNIFSQAWSISAIKEFDKEDKDGFIGKMYSLMNFAMLIICSGLIILNMPIAKILYSNEFFEAWKYIPPLLISIVFNSMSLFIGSIFTAVKDTKTLSISTIIGAFINILSSFAFIYFFGAYGASIATLIGYATTLIMRHYILRRYIRMKIYWKRDLTCYIFIFLQMIIAIWGWITIPIQCIFFIIILAMYRSEIKSILSLLKSKLHKNAYKIK